MVTRHIEDCKTVQNDSYAKNQLHWAVNEVTCLCCHGNKNSTRTRYVEGCNCPSKVTKTCQDMSTTVIVPTNLCAKISILEVGSQHQNEACGNR